MSLYFEMSIYSYSLIPPKMTIRYDGPLCPFVSPVFLYVCYFVFIIGFVHSNTNTLYMDKKGVFYFLRETLSVRNI